MSASLVLRRRLATELRELRRKAGLSQEQVAEQIDASLMKLTRIENALSAVSAGDLRLMLDLYGADRDTRDELLELGKQARKRGGWWSAYRDVLRGPYVQLEAEAAVVRNYESSLMPGLLQTADYMRAAAARHPTVTPEEVERRIVVRSRRQERLADDNPLTVQVVMDEGVLRRLVGNPEIISGQLSHIAAITELPNVSVRVIPYSAGMYDALGYPFTVLRFRNPTDPPIALVEHLTGELYLNPEETAVMDAVFEDVRSLAVSDGDSVKLIESIMRGWTT